ncbi:MAG: sigma-70 family RNA polymerase sigma factor [Rivularia sp. (in: cyanobacteria)]
MNKNYQSYQAMSDEEIVTQIIEGDEWAVAYFLIYKCGSRLKFLAQKKFQTLKLEFHEVVSELFIHLHKNDWKALRDFRGKSKFGRSCKLENYISLIASRLLWKRMNLAVKDIDWIVPLYDVEGSLIPDNSVERQQLVESVIEAIMSLENIGEREVLLLYKIEGRSVDEVAEILNISTNNVYTRCSRGLKNLQVLLEKGGVYA